MYCRVTYLRGRARRGVWQSPSVSVSQTHHSLCSSLTLNNAGSLFNHANNPNVSFNLSYSTYTIQYKTFRTVEAGEELSIFYGHGTHFSDDDNAIAGVDVVPESDAWGGLTGISNDEAFSCNSSEQHSNDDEEDEEDEVGGSETSTRVDAELKQSAGDEELLAWDDLPWDKVTDLIDPQDVGLTTRKSLSFPPALRHHYASVETSRFHLLDSSVEARSKYLY